METNNNPKESERNEKEVKKSWFERHLWVIALFLALFLVRMCGELSRG